MKLQKIISIPLCLCAVLALLSCSRVEGGKVGDVLDCAYSLMEERPDSALALLESIPEESLYSRRLLARRSLLLAMARDKNCIDDTTDAVIAPAVDWYRRYGTADEKLLMNYYRGRIAMNAGDYETAVKWLLTAERYQRASKNALHSARIHTAKSWLYNDMYNSEATIREEKSASALFLEAGDSSRYFNSVINLAAEYNKKKDSASVVGYLSVLEKGWSKLSENQRSLYYSAMLIHLSYFGKDKVDNVLHLYVKDIEDPSLIRWEIVAYANYLIEKYEPAFEAINRYLDYGGEKDLAYLWINGVISESLGYYSAAADSFHKFINTDGNKDIGLFNSDAKFIEERTESGRKIENQHYTIIIVILLLLSAVLAVFILIGRYNSQKKINRAKAAALNAEKEVEKERAARAEAEAKRLEVERSQYECLYNKVLMQKEILEDAQKEMPKLGDEIKGALREQLNALNKFFMANITSMYSKNAAEQLAELITDQEHFLVMLRSSFLVGYPKFMAYLKESGLSDKEMGYCCLYCIGLNGKETASFLARSSYRNEVTKIRKALRISQGDTNIDIFLRRKLAELS